MLEVQLVKYMYCSSHSRHNVTVCLACEARASFGTFQCLLIAVLGVLF